MIIWKGRKREREGGRGGRERGRGRGGRERGRGEGRLNTTLSRVNDDIKKRHHQVLNDVSILGKEKLLCYLMASDTLLPKKEDETRMYTYVPHIAVFLIIC